MLGDTYDDLPPPIKISDEIGKQNPHIKLFVKIISPDADTTIVTCAQVKPVLPEAA